MRLILDCSEAVNNDIGPDTEHVREDELVKRLKGIRIGYNPNTQDGIPRNYIVSGLKNEGLSARLDAALENTPPILDAVLDNALPILSRAANSSVHDAMNRRLKEEISTWKSYQASRRHKPTASEVYEDVNWRF
ncbi:hypothetical protein RRF57_006021 [Xylaria bambusicola]|uniref:Uncharacterized protein n=1 Tax=Xylaria bambusicola TaxID=326684 RepID=A0AAN7Z9L0_9PEZI